MEVNSDRKGQMSGRPHLILTGYSSASALEDIFAGFMTDVAYLGEANDSRATVFPDDPEHVDLNKSEDREWLIEVVRGTLRTAGQRNVSIAFVAAMPEISCDLNAGATVHAYRLTSGSCADLEKLGLTPDQAIGMRFSFNGGGDTDENGQDADIMFDGTIVKDEYWGYLAVADEKGIYWRVRTS